MTQSSDRPANVPGSGTASGTGGAYGFVRNGHDRAQAHDVSTADLERATVYGRENEILGTVSGLQIGADGKVTAAVIDVGGFLGLGAHSVLLPFGDLTVLRRADSRDISVYLDTTRAKLKAMPHHSAGA